MLVCTAFLICIDELLIFEFVVIHFEMLHSFLESQPKSLVIKLCYFTDILVNCECGAVQQVRKSCRA